MEDNLYSTEKNRFFRLFDKIFGNEDQNVKDQIIKNSQATSEQEYRSATMNTHLPNSYSGFIQGQQISYDQFFQTKKQKIDKLREMTDYPDVIQALDWVCNDVVVTDSEGKTIEFIIKGTDFSQDEREKLHKIGNYILDDVLQVNKNLWSYCRRYLTEGEIYLEKIVNDTKNSLIGVKVVPAYIMTPVYESNIIQKFVQLGLDKNGNYSVQDKSFSENQITYVHWDEYIDGDVYNPKSYLWYAIRAYNMLKSIEDSLLTYRITRSIERRIFNIEVGNMPTGKAKEFIQKLIQSHRKTQTYDPATGQINQSKNLMSFNEDFWFETRNGQGSSVKNLESGMNLGELRDVDYFQKKLYKALKIPKSRWDEVKQAVYNPGRTAEIERDELDFAAFVTRIQNRMKRMFMDLFLTELKLRGFDGKFIDPRNYDFKYSQIDYLGTYKELDLLENRAQILNLYSPYIQSSQNKDGMFSKEFILKRFFKMTEDEYQTNNEMVEREKTELAEKEFLDSIQTRDLGGGTDEVDPETGEVSQSMPLGDGMTIFDLYDTGTEEN